MADAKLTALTATTSAAAADLMRYLRAHTFPGYGLRYRQDGKLIEAAITLKEVTE